MYIHLEQLVIYYGQGVREPVPLPNRGKAQRKDDDTLKVNISYGAIAFSAEGKADHVIKQMQRFSDQMLPEVIANLKKTSEAKKHVKEQSAKGKKQTLSVGESLRKRNPKIIKLKDKMDFKAKMIPLLFLADEYGYQKVFSIRDIQTIMIDAIDEKAEKKQIEDVLTRRASWFEKTSQNPRQFCLLDIAKDYARNILVE